MCELLSLYNFHSSMLCLLDLAPPPPEPCEKAEERNPGSLDRRTPGTLKMDWSAKTKTNKFTIGKIIRVKQTGIDSFASHERQGEGKRKKNNNILFYHRQGETRNTCIFP